MNSDEKILALRECDSVDRIFSNDKIDPIGDYREIVTSPFIEMNVVQEFILEMINRGNSSVVADNLSCLSIDANWRIAKQNPGFKELFCNNFEETVGKTRLYGFSPNTIREISQTLDDNTAFVNKWQRLAKMTEFNAVARAELIKALELSEAGQNVVDTNLPALFYGDYTYPFFIDLVLKDGILSKEQVAGLIVQDPTRIIQDTLNSTYIMTGYSFSELLDKVDEIITTTPSVGASQISEVRTAVEAVIAEHFEEIVEKARVDDEEGGEKKYSVQLLKAMKKWDTDEHKIGGKLVENYDKISGNINKGETMDLLHLYSDIDVFGKKGLSLEEVIEQTFSYIQDPDIRWSVTKIASELLEDQGLTPEQMEIYGSGHYNKSIKIGDYIFKIGKDRSTPEVPQDENLIQPLIRQTLKGKDDEAIFLEVQDLVDKDWYKGLSEEEVTEELYKIYASVRDNGHRWTDVRKENVGRLLKPNDGLYHINGQELKAFNSALGYKESKISKESPKTLQAGELVIIDTDFVFEQESSYSYSNVSMHRELEERYQREKSERAAKAPEILATAVDASKEAVSQQDIQVMAQSVTDRAKTQEFGENAIATDDKTTTERG